MKLPAPSKLNLAEPADRAKGRVIIANCRPLVSPYRRRLPVTAQSLDQRASRVLRRLFTVYGALERVTLKRIAFAALREPPDLRMLLKTLRYLERLPIKYHDEIVDELLTLLEPQRFLLPFHIAAILGSLGRLHPSRARLNLAGKVTWVASRKTADWNVRQQALQLLAILPNREGTALKRALNALDYPHPFVRRAGMVMLTRTQVTELRELTILHLGDPDPAVSLVAISWNKLMQDRDAGTREAKKLMRAEVSDRAFLWKLNKLWLLRASVHPQVVKLVRDAIARHESSASAKVQWHIRELYRRTEWAGGDARQKRYHL